jgi:hypothetical protein
MNVLNLTYKGEGRTLGDQSSAVRFVLKIG